VARRREGSDSRGTTMARGASGRQDRQKIPFPFFQGFKRSCHRCRAQLRFSQAGGRLDLSSRSSNYFNWNL